MIRPQEITVRQARPGDVSSIVSFSAAMARETEGRELDLERLRAGTVALLTSPAHGFFMVAETPEPDPKVVGQLMITYEWSDWRNGVFWWIQSVYVDRSWRRRGVYRRMHETVIALGKADPTVCGVRLYVARDNRQAQTAYRRVGLSPSVYDVYEEDFILTPHHPR
ncbi:MAG TPA: GNAT family N-acetyltransferase [Nitrospira sp.]|nr:GNAT family N-acetyltransferase [Nitrospira sp.]